MKYNGVINVLKPTGMTSHDVVNKIRRIANQKKVGHTGTLDPDVSGVLPICLGKATKISDYLMKGDKTYICQCIVGLLTDTYDTQGKILKEISGIILEEKDVEGSLKKIKNLKIQRPPIFSSVKYKGKKLYEYARKEVDITPKIRDIKIHEIELISIYKNTFTFKAKVSKGTYMRSMCYDLGKMLNSCGTMGNLIRLSAKGFNISDSLTLEEIEKKAIFENLESCIIPIEKALKLPMIEINKKDKNKILNGMFIENSKDSKNLDEPFYIFSEGKLIGFGEYREDKIKLKKQLC